MVNGEKSACGNNEIDDKEVESAKRKCEYKLGRTLVLVGFK